ncbi:hypothetical protein [Photobacterium angustum]|uniref:hypothetical protein n=1 Tax=Photobacterium angustum TaxID=661 RepID=UPI0005E5E6BC|nr:hypothetical protein [Photobacterium angustum]KJF99169.1 hypothetical protein UB35_20850 [Photobacterium angustum]PSV59917.1 hypothetical protein CTM95_21720 [Photobacterium angustum]
MSINSSEFTLFSMSTADVAFWGMIGTWVAGIGTFVAVAVSLYFSRAARRHELRLKISDDFNKIYVLNLSSIVSVISDVNLVERDIFNFKKDKVINNDSFYHIAVKDMMESFSFITVKSYDEVYTIELNQENMFIQYKKLLGFNENDELIKPTKMRACSLRIILITGESFYVKLPNSFYKRFKESLLVNNSINSLDSFIYYRDYYPNSISEAQQRKWLERYYIARKNHYLLYM